jgi:molybdenum cofactor biosynthesis enzyme
MVREARSAADAVVVKAGVAEPSELYSWLEKNDLNRAMNIRDAFARGQVRPLQEAAKQYAASHGSGISAADEADIMSSKNVNGGKLFYQGSVAMVEIDGRRMTLREAHRQGFVRIS